MANRHHFYGQVNVDDIVGLTEFIADAGPGGIDPTKVKNYAYGATYDAGDIVRVPEWGLFLVSADGTTAPAVTRPTPKVFTAGAVPDFNAVNPVTTTRTLRGVRQLVGVPQDARMTYLTFGDVSVPDAEVTIHRLSVVNGAFVWGDPILTVDGGMGDGAVVTLDLQANAQYGLQATWDEAVDITFTRADFAAWDYSLSINLGNVPQYSEDGTTWVIDNDSGSVVPFNFVALNTSGFEYIDTFPTGYTPEKYLRAGYQGLEWHELPDYTVYTPRGEWTQGVTYNADDIVIYEGSSYLVLTTHQAQDVFNSANFQLLAERGRPGVQGATGSTGPVGATGATGPRGADSQVPGPIGPQGQPGATGPAGATGASGVTYRGAWNATTAYAANDLVTWNKSGYITSTAHAAGEVPPTGTTSAPGSDPAAVNTGWTLFVFQGAPGPTGLPGASGVNGRDGANGVDGATGATGPQGLRGFMGPGVIAGHGAPTVETFDAEVYIDVDTGTVYQSTNTSYRDVQVQALAFRGAWQPTTTYRPWDVITYGGSSYFVATGFTSGGTFNADNLLLLAQAGTPGTNGSTGAIGATGPVGPTGPVGAKGDKGDAGVSPKLSVVSTTTSAAGGNALVDMGGTTAAPTLAFTIPRGAAGPAGATGATGATGSAGPAGATGATGATGAGVATGGAAYQVLRKNSSTNYDTTWSAAVPSMEMFKSSSQTISSGGGTNYLSLQSWRGSTYLFNNFSGGQATCGVTGYYWLYLKVGWDAATSGATGGRKIVITNSYDGRTAAGWMPGANGYTTQETGGLFYVPAGYTVSVTANNTATSGYSTVMADPYCTFTALLLGS